MTINAAVPAAADEADADLLPRVVEAMDRECTKAGRVRVSVPVRCGDAGQLGGLPLRTFTAETEESSR